MKAINTNIPFLLAVVSVCALIATITLISLNPPTPAFGSVGYGNEYHSTTTAPAFFPAEKTLMTTPGSLGSVVITGAGAGVINIYDATTSNVALRTNQAPTSTILLASFPTSAAVGTYTFDLQYYSGLYISIVGTMPTTTITYR